MNQTRAVRSDEIGVRIYPRIYVLVSKKGGGWASAIAIVGLLGGLLSDCHLG